MKIVAFGHRKRVGKDTAVNLLYRHIVLSNKRVKVQKCSFAYELKMVCYTLYSWAGLQMPSFYEKAENEHLRETVLDAIGLTPRDIWIQVGNKLREVYSDTWIKLALNKYSSCDILLISDMRYPNEVEAIKQIGGLTVRIDRPSIPHSDDVADSALSDYGDWDVIIPNDNDIESFNGRLILLWDSLKA